MEMTLRWAGLDLILLLGAGLTLAIAGARRRELDVREALARFLYEEKRGQALGPPEVSPSRQALLLLGFLGAGTALGLLLWPIQQAAAGLAGLGLAVAGLLWLRQTSGVKEKREAAEDVLPLVAHLRQTLGRGITTRQALHAFAHEIEPGRALAHRVESCLAAVEMGVDLGHAFDAWVAREDVRPGAAHLQALGDLLREVQRSRDPQRTLDRLSRKIVRDLRQEKRLQVKRQALASIAVTVLGLFPPLMLALLEPAAFRLFQSLIFSGAF